MLRSGWRLPPRANVRIVQNISNSPVFFFFFALFVFVCVCCLQILISLIVPESKDVLDMRLAQVELQHKSVVRRVVLPTHSVIYRNHFRMKHEQDCQSC
jgi:hypothetical protein